jgi:hypothetical protein
MENTRNKRVGIGQKPRGKQEARGVEAPSQEKEVAVAAGQEQGVKEPVSEPVHGIARGDGLEAENSPKVDETEFFEKTPSVAVLEDDNLEQMLAKSIYEDGHSEDKKIEEIKAEQQKFADEHPPRIQQALHRQIGEQADGSFNVVVRLEEGYIEPVRQWAEAEGISIETWCSRQLSHYLETWGQPAKSR